MTGLRAAIATELLKSRRSRVPWGVAVGFTLAPLVGGLFMLILEDPDRARKLGLLGAKAQLTAGTADWPTFLDMVGQSIAIGGAILFAFLTAWLFGREFTDRTMRALLATPTTRSAIVVAKLVVLALWSAAIAVWVVALALAIGLALDLPAWSADDALPSLAGMLVAAVMTIGLQTTTAFWASAGRGYIPALGWAVITIALGQILAVLGWGPVFPWSAPALIAGAGGQDVGSVGAVGVAAVAVTVVVGFAATIAWWQRADQTG
jgi:ABC-2 type transport system permease protein